MSGLTNFTKVDYKTSEKDGSTDQSSLEAMTCIKHPEDTTGSTAENRLRFVFGKQFLYKTVDFKYDTRSVQRTKCRAKYSNRKLVSLGYTISNDDSDINLLRR